MFRLTATFPNGRVMVMATGDKSTLTAIMNRLKKLTDAKFALSE